MWRNPAAGEARGIGRASPDPAGALPVPAEVQVEDREGPKERTVPRRPEALRGPAAREVQAVRPAPMSQPALTAPPVPRAPRERTAAGAAGVVPALEARWKRAAPPAPVF